jgi:hypothetical protein
MLPETINNSISNRQQHLGHDAVKELFFKTHLNPVERYAVDVMFTEASLQEIVDFLKSNRIPFGQAARLYAIHKALKKDRKGSGISDKYEWLFGSFSGSD